ncbi:MAG: hypothetical protein KBS52_00815, partial [Clostridiales bacterium]|nr:hypothetical protein [Candidatus Equinaster intestinalis]
MKKCLSIVLALLCALSVFSAAAYAEPAEVTEKTDGTQEIAVPADTGSVEYADYLETNKNLKDAEKADEIFIKGNSFTANEGAVVTAADFTDEENVKKDGAIKWEKEKGSLTYTFNVAKAGFYT